MSKVGLDNNSQSKLKALSKIIEVIAKIGRIAIYICIPFIIFAAIITPVVINHTELKDDEIVFKYKDDKVTIKVEDDKVEVYHNDKKVDGEKDGDVAAFNSVKKVLDKYSNKQLIGYVEAGFILMLTYLILIILILKHLGKLFKNIRVGDTPFTLDNVEHMRKMSIYMISLIILPIITSILYQLVADIDLNISFSLVSVIEMLFVMAMSYIFKYGYELQSDSKKKMYDED